jgi:Flp pilus assembly protein TadD
MPTPPAWCSLAGLLLLGACTAQETSIANEGKPDLLNVADAAIAGNQPEMALQVSQAMLAKDPDNLLALYHEGAAYYAIGRCQDAIAAYRVALKLAPKSSQAETGIGRCLLKRNPLEAEQAFAAAVADDPSNAAALNNLGLARDLRGNFAGATQPYQQALLLDPGNIAIEVNMGLSLALSGNADDALQYLGPLANSQQATPKIREDYALALIAAGRQDEARRALSIDMTPDQTNAALAGYTALLAAVVTTPASSKANIQPSVTQAPAPLEAAAIPAPTPSPSAQPAPTPVPPASVKPVVPPQPAQVQLSATAPGNEILR